MPHSYHESISLPLAARVIYFAGGRLVPSAPSITHRLSVSSGLRAPGTLTGVTRPPGRRAASVRIGEARTRTGAGPGADPRAGTETDPGGGPAPVLAGVASLAVRDL